MLPRRVHIVGASGSGTSTLGAALARHMRCKHLDIDSFFWLPTDPPFQVVRPRPERQKLLAEALASCSSWTLSGSLCGWGDPFIVQFDLVVFLWLDPVVRIDRLRAREVKRYGLAIAPGGPMHTHHQEFMQWAAAYDEGGLEMRSRRHHEQWLAALPCPVIRLEGDMPTDAQVGAICGEIDGP